ncbi:MAG: KOW domain-containing RNA-binding protein [Clostridiales bacterium]|nr:KOW domain-containing RNA-binding protein [Clostridiales bacterium]
MNEITAGCLAKSLAGHDKDRYFIILSVDEDYVMLADGKNRPVERPKRKKRKHIQAQKQPLLAEGPFSNEAVRAAIRDYEKTAAVK